MRLLATASLLALALAGCASNPDRAAPSSPAAGAASPRHSSSVSPASFSRSSGSR